MALTERHRRDSHRADHRQPANSQYCQSSQKGRHGGAQDLDRLRYDSAECETQPEDHQ